jgi:hypothetical protein
MIRAFSLSCMTLAVALAQGPAGPGGRHFGPPPDGPFQGARFLGAEAGIPGHVVKNAPFSADIVTERTQTLSDGNHIKQSTTVHLSRDSEGRTRSEQSLSSLAANGLASPSSNRTVVFIHDPVAGASYALNATSKTATRSMHPARASANTSGSGQTAQGTSSRPRAAFAGGGRRGGMNNQNIKTESLGTQTIEGVVAQGTRTTLTIPAGQMGNEQPIQIVTERWYSSDLQATVMVKRSDPRGGDSVTRYTNVSRAEPSPTLFQVPSDYKVQDAARGSRPAAQ